jgi:ElaB/YqjD/DUF883 family membrane-anchored ribosome-binding protein
MNIALYGSHGSVERKKDRLVLDLKGVVADADDLLQEVAGATAEEFAATRARIEGRLREARSRLDQARIAVAGKVCDAAEATQEYARENPWKAFGIPAVAGLLVFLLVSRR